MVEQPCEYFSASGRGRELPPRCLPQAHFGGVAGKITRATPKYPRDIKEHVLRVRGLVALEQADGRGAADPPTNERPHIAAIVPCIYSGGFDSSSLPEHFLRSQVFSGF
jgi:hypothetical protein